MKSDPRGCECEDSWNRTAQQSSDCEPLPNTGLCSHDRRKCLMQATRRGDVWCFGSAVRSQQPAGDHVQTAEHLQHALQQGRECVVDSEELLLGISQEALRENEIL